MTQLMTGSEELERQQLEEAIASLYQLRVPLVVNDLDFRGGTWKGAPVSVEQISEIADSLSKNEAWFVRTAHHLVNWGRNYEFRRLLWGDDDDDDDTR